MKYLTLLALTLSFAAHAADSDVFREDSKLPAELQAKVLAAVTARCSTEHVGFKEVATVVSENNIDQGQKDFYYSTSLAAIYYFDGMRTVGVDIIVESAEYAITNPSIERTEVLSVSVKSFITGICE